jgi:hypothetical protein
MVLVAQSSNCFSVGKKCDQWGNTRREGKANPLLYRRAEMGEGLLLGLLGLVGGEGCWGKGFLPFGLTALVGRFFQQRLLFFFCPRGRQEEAGQGAAVEGEGLAFRHLVSSHWLAIFCCSFLLLFFLIFVFLYKIWLQAGW